MAKGSLVDTNIPLSALITKHVPCGLKESNGHSPVQKTRPGQSGRAERFVADLACLEPH